MDFEKLGWYIIPYNMGDFKIVGADSSDTQRELEDGGDFFIYNTKVYVVLLNLSKGLRKREAAIVDDKGYYESHFESYKFKKYTWKEIQPIAIDLMYKWYENNNDLRPSEYYKVKQR